jgi:hypothetical protein
MTLPTQESMLTSVACKTTCPHPSGHGDSLATPLSILIVQPTLLLPIPLVPMPRYVRRRKGILPHDRRYRRRCHRRRCCRHISQHRTSLLRLCCSSRVHPRMAGGRELLMLCEWYGGGHETWVRRDGVLG